jgi:uncharacterized membrane protein (UPF0127 family)
MQSRTIRNLTQPLKQDLKANYCDGFWCKFRGLMFERSLPTDQALILADAKSSRLNSGIHMLGMFFDLSIIWVGEDFKVVDKAKARRWLSFVFPKKPARYVIECDVSRYEEFSIGDQLVFEEAI